MTVDNQGVQVKIRIGAVHNDVEIRMSGSRTVVDLTGHDDHHAQAVRSNIAQWKLRGAVGFPDLG